MASILAVDDEPNIRFLYEEEFRDEGYTVHSAANISEALHLYEEVHPDLLIVDINLAEESGIVLLEKIREKDKKVFIVISSAYDDYKQDFHVWASDAYVMKQQDLSELKQVVHSLLSKKKV